MKKFTAVLSALIMILSLTACNQTAPAASSSPSGADNRGDSAEDLAQDYYMTMGSTMTSSAVITPLIAAACEKIEERTDGHVIIDFFPDSTLGSDAEMFSQLQNGELEFLNTGIMAKTMINDYAFITGYWWMQDMDHFWAVWNSEIGDRYRTVMEEDYNTHQVSASLLGLHNLISTKPVTTLDDFKGLQLRISSNPAAVELWKAIGVNVNIMPWGEVIPSLQTGVIDTVGHTYQQFYDTGLQELASYLTQTNHEADVTNIYACNEIWNSLPSAYRTIIQEEFDACFDEFDILRDKAMEDARQSLIASGIEFTELDPEIRTQIVTMMEPVLKNIFETTWTGATFEEVMSFSS